MAAPLIEKAGTASRSVVHRAVVAAPADLCFDLVAQVERAPRYFPGHLHAEVTAGADGASETVERWVVVPGGGVRNWTAHRTVDVAAHRIGFGHAGGGRPPVSAVRGEWAFEEAPDGATEVRLEHVLGFAAGTDDEAAKAALADVDRGARAQLAHLRTVAESYDRLTARTVEAESWARFAGPRAEGVFERLTGAADVYGEGWAKAVVPGRAVVLKRVAELDDRLSAATARAVLTPTPDGVEVALSTTATASPDGPAPEVLGRWLRQVTTAALARVTGGPHPRRDG